jgi:hypothetical protein
MGSRLIEGGLSHGQGGQTQVDFARSGLRFSADVPLPP